MNFPKKLTNKLQKRQEANALRHLKEPTNLVDFSSNDYLGFANSEIIFNKTHRFLIENNLTKNGATGSRLLSGNYPLYQEIETLLSSYHNTKTTTIFNSGYDANVGFFSAIPQRGDVILYDEFIHASIRDGIQLSNAKSYKFKHNNLVDLDEMLKRFQHDKSEIYVATESVFSMDGDTPDLMKLSEICKKNNVFLIVDEAHALGVFGENGCGIVQKRHLEKEIFARIVTFGKALGCHGAAILGSKKLQEYLVNFARSFIYTTGLSPHSLATIQTAYKLMLKEPQHQQKLTENISFFKKQIKKNQLEQSFTESNSAIQCCVIPGNETIKEISKQLQEKGFDVKAVLSPTVPKGKERLRFCLHSYNSKEEITTVLELLVGFVTSL